MSLLLDALKKAAEDKEKNAPAKSAEKEAIKAKDEAESTEIITPEVDEELLIETEQGDLDEELELDLPQDFEELEEADEAVTIDEPSIGESIEVTASKEDKISAVVKLEQAVVQQPGSENKKAEELDDVTLQQSNSVTDSKTADPLPAYDHSDARKILEVSQKRYRNNQRIAYYGLYVFAALLFFVASYFYYTAEILDNSDKPVFRPSHKTKQQQILVQSNNALDSAVEQPVVAEADVTKSKESDSSVVVNKKTKVAKSPVTKKKITIIKQKKADPISVLLQRAYDHYQAAEYKLSDEIYLLILQRDKRQRDALLGRAAIAVVNKKLSTAKKYYQLLLHYYPDDSIASSALVDLVKEKITVSDESQLNLLLRDNPDAAHVHFSLGVLYSKQNRIKESQQSFFNAFALEKKADYAYNLAVLLDKLGQPKAALSYYKQASELSDKSIIHFNEKVVLERISQLGGDNE